MYARDGPLLSGVLLSAPSSCFFRRARRFDRIDRERRRSEYPLDVSGFHDVMTCGPSLGKCSSVLEAVADKLALAQTEGLSVVGECRR